MENTEKLENAIQHLVARINDLQDQIGGLKTAIEKLTEKLS